jgi:hypothetical protein
MIPLRGRKEDERLRELDAKLKSFQGRTKEVASTPGNWYEARGIVRSQVARH